MYLKDSQNKLIKEIETSFEYSYASICGQPIDTQKLLQQRLEKDNGWVRFYPESNAYAPDTDDTALFYIALVKQSPAYVNDALKVVQEIHALKTLSGMAVTWPQRNMSDANQEDYLVNVHFLWLLHLLGMRDEVIENLVLNWLESDQLETTYYHNKSFVLFSCSMALKDFIDSDFKSTFKRLLENQKDLIPAGYSDLKFEQGIFKHAGRDVFFHLFSDNNDKADQSLIEGLLNHYALKLEQAV